MRIAQFVAISALAIGQSMAVHLSDATADALGMTAKTKLEALIEELDKDHNSKLDDNELSIIMTKVNENKDGFITFGDLTQLAVLAGIKPTPAYLNTLWADYKSPYGEYM